MSSSAVDDGTFTPVSVAEAVILIPEVVLVVCPPPLLGRAVALLVEEIGTPEAESENVDLVEASGRLYVQLRVLFPYGVPVPVTVAKVVDGTDGRVLVDEGAAGADCETLVGRTDRLLEEDARDLEVEEVTEI